MDDEQDPQLFDKFAIRIAAMAAAYDKECDEAMLEGYWLTLSDLPFETVMEAVVECMRAYEFFPRASQIRQHTEQLIRHAALEATRLEQEGQRESELIAHQIVKHHRRLGRTEEQIRDALEIASEKLGTKLYWPGEEPWSREAEFRRREPLVLDFDELEDE